MGSMNHSKEFKHRSKTSSLDYENASHYERRIGVSSEPRPGKCSQPRNHFLRNESIRLALSSYSNRLFSNRYTDSSDTEKGSLESPSSCVDFYSNLKLSQNQYSNHSNFANDSQASSPKKQLIRQASVSSSSALPKDGLMLTTKGVPQKSKDTSPYQQIGNIGISKSETLLESRTSSPPHLSKPLDSLNPNFQEASLSQHSSRSRSQHYSFNPQPCESMIPLPLAYSHTSPNRNRLIRSNCSQSSSSISNNNPSEYNIINSWSSPSNHKKFEDSSFNYSPTSTLSSFSNSSNKSPAHYLSLKTKLSHQIDDVNSLNRCTQASLSTLQENLMKLIDQEYKSDKSSNRSEVNMNSSSSDIYSQAAEVLVNPNSDETYKDPYPVILTVAQPAQVISSIPSSPTFNGVENSSSSFNDFPTPFQNNVESKGERDC